jgi:hypothetical protein
MPNGFPGSHFAMTVRSSQLPKLEIRSSGPPHETELIEINERGLKTFNRPVNREPFADPPAQPASAMSGS